MEDIKDHPGFSPVKVDYSNAINIVAPIDPKRNRQTLYLMGILMWFQRDLMKCGHAIPLIQRLKAIGCTVGGRYESGHRCKHICHGCHKKPRLPTGCTCSYSVSVEEECTGNGALACLVRGYNAEAAIIPEPVDDKLVRGNTVLWFKISVKGLPYM